MKSDGGSGGEEDFDIGDIRYNNDHNRGKCDY
jgi:hypothetical protein